MSTCVNVECPYCGKVQRICISDGCARKGIIICNGEDGGCDRYFVADITVSVAAKGLKIEGEEQAKEATP